jgi:hypothetical protein
MLLHCMNTYYQAISLPQENKTGRDCSLPAVLLLLQLHQTNYLMSGTISNATMFTTLIMGLMAGPAVSL